MVTVWWKTCAEFFAGIGLMRLGLERAGWEVIFAHDISPQKRALYLGHFGAAHNHFTLGDIYVLSAEDVPTVTLATASFPCTDISLAGRRAGLAGTHSLALHGFFRVLEEMGSRRPPLVLLENVRDFRTSQGGADFTTTLQALNRLGYTVDAFELDAANFMPQSRKRLFIVGTQVSLAAETPGAAVALTPSATRPQALLDAIARNADVRWRVRPLPPLQQCTQRLDELLEDLPDDAPEWRSAEWVATLLAHTNPTHRARAERMIAEDHVTYAGVYHRTRTDGVRAEIRTDGLAGCLRTPGGGSSQQFLLKAGGGRAQVRQVTPREAARLMGAGEYRITGSTTAALYGFGDAVFADVVAWIAAHYLDSLLTELRAGVPICDKAA